MNPDGAPARHAEIDQLLPQLGDRNRTAMDRLAQPQFLFAHEAAHIVLPQDFLGEALHSAAERPGHDSAHPAPAREIALTSAPSRLSIADVTQPVTAAEIWF